MRKTYLLFFCFILVLMPLGAAPAVNPALLQKLWPAHWASHPEAGREFGIYHFRKTITLPARPSSYVVHVSADNRFELFVNGKRASLGPARGDLNHWRFETVDLAPQLQAGKNVLAAVVWNFGREAPMAQMTSQTGFLMQGDTEAESAVNTPKGWKCSQNKSYTPLPKEELVNVYYASGPGEKVDGSKYPWGWQQPDYDDSQWVKAVDVSPAMPQMVDGNSMWRLVPDPLPDMESREDRFQRVVRAPGLPAESVAQAMIKGDAPMTIPANTKGTLLLDRGHLTTCYPELSVSGGKGSQIKVIYAEALFKQRPGDQPMLGEKGNRNDVQGKVIFGEKDLLLPDGGQSRLFRPLWWRTYRYVQLDVQTGAEPLKIEDYKGQFTAYPFVAAASVEAPDKDIAKIWETGWRTARLCAHETYMDTPYYEQLQYVGDTRIQALISLYVSGDDRLMRNAIDSIDDSRIPEGVTQSRYPTYQPQFIPTFSLFWINMIHDFWLNRDDPAFVKTYLPGTRSVLTWYEQHLPSSGLLGGLPWWPFVDWCPQWPEGMAPGVTTGNSSILSLQLAITLRDAADLEEQLGEKTLAQHYRDVAERLVAAVRQACWNEQRGLFADTPEQKEFSQHANILAVLAGAVPAGGEQALLKKVTEEPSLTQATYYFRHYLGRAMNRAGLGDLYVKSLGPWRQMVEMGLTTFAENPEPTRSDCHAWSASPNYELLATVAGIEPAEPGFRSVRIRPHLGPLPWLKAKMPHPAGLIEVDLRKEGDRVTGTVTLPRGLRGTFESNGKQTELVPGKTTLP